MFRNWGNSNGASKRLGQVCPLPGTLSWEAGWECWVAAEVSTELPNGWVTLSQEGQKGKKSWIALRMVENYTNCTAKATLLPHLSFSTDIGKTESNEEERARAHNCLLASHNPLWLYPASICCVLLFETESLHGPVESAPRGGISFAYAHLHTWATFYTCVKHSPARVRHPLLVRGARNWGRGGFFWKQMKNCTPSPDTSLKKKSLENGGRNHNTIIDEPSHKLLQTNNSGPDPKEKCLPTHSDTTQNMHCAAYYVWNHRNSLSHRMIGTIHHKLETRPLFQSCTWGLKSNVTIFIITSAKVFSWKNYLCRKFAPTNGVAIWLGSSNFQRKIILLCLSRSK